MSYTPQEVKNREIVLDYYEKLIGQWDYEAASVHLADRFIQHNPTIADGLEGVKAFVSAVPPQLAEVMKYRIARVLVDGDMVMLHLLFSIPGMPDRAIVDLYRVEHGKIAEHWDIAQEVPAEALHNNDMV